MTNPARLLVWQQRIKHLLIDEYQDSNAMQYTLVKLLVGDRARFYGRWAMMISLFMPGVAPSLKFSAIKTRLSPITDH